MHFFGVYKFKCLPPSDHYYTLQISCAIRVKLAVLCGSFGFSEGDM